MKTENDNTNIKNSESVEKTNTFECTTCGQHFKFFKTFQKHVLRHKGAGGFICRTCGMSFTSSEARERHRDKEHKTLRCRICNINFDNNTEFLLHINTLHDGRDRELSMCSECGKQFKTKGELMHHVSSKCGTIKRFKCPHCDQTLMTAGSLHNHLLRHTGQRTYMCRYCAKTFLTAGQLTVHERIHTQEKAFICEVCNKGFCHRQSLITHSTLHTGIKPYQCEGCGSSFSCIGNLLKHRKTHMETCGKIPLTTHRVKHPATKIKVQVNTPSASKPKTLEKIKKLEMAKNIKTNINNDNIKPDMIETEHTNNTSNEIENGSNIDDENLDIRIDICADVLKTKHNLIDAQKLDKQENVTDILRTYLLILPTTNAKSEEQNHKNDKDLFENKTPEKENFNKLDELEPQENDSGEETFDNNDSNSLDDLVEVHITEVKLPTNEKCIKENPNKTEKKTLKKRNKRKLKNSLLKKIQDSDIDSCKFCGATYTIARWLIKHEEKCGIEKETRTYKCSCCSATFPTKEESMSHQQYEHADILTCKQCEKIFANPDSVKAHINFYHKGIPRKVYIYVCEKCGQVFKQKALLIAHEQNHCGNGPLFKCDICEKSFSNKHVLKSHMRVHAPEKPLLCKFCGKSFHWKGQLKVHERSHTGEKPFKCLHCPKAFAYRESLFTHSTLHTGIRPHLCEACGSRFSCYGNLAKHRRTHANSCGVSINK